CRARLMLPPQLPRAFFLFCAQLSAAHKTKHGGPKGPPCQVVVKRKGNYSVGASGASGVSPAGASGVSPAGASGASGVSAAGASGASGTSGVAGAPPQASAREEVKIAKIAHLLMFSSNVGMSRLVSYRRLSYQTHKLPKMAHGGSSFLFFLPPSTHP
ncbi:MAG TPA: hypothetical protein PLV85_16935, partial [Polyangiaceae bacterium]|nr:hypothetical protein [Polyangiaceae bacterium]